MKTIIFREDARLEACCVATIGCFDGVHLGHRLLIDMVMQKAKERGLLSAVITFDRQPREVFDPDFRPQLLSRQREKSEVIASLGVDLLVVLPFTKELANLSAQAFMQQILHDRLNVSVLIAGYDHRFGHNRTEGFNDYVRYGKALGMEVFQGDVAYFPGEEKAVSSSVIRQLLKEGKMEMIQEVLARSYSLAGKVVQGEHIGHELGFPTANLELDDPNKMIPALGVYAVWAVIGEERLAAMMNIGTRPTFEGTAQTLEVHIFSNVGNLYDKMLTVEFVKRLRDEKLFASPEDLVEQLKHDREQALSCLKVKL